MKSVNTSSINIGAVVIPVKVYTAHHQFKFSGHYYHDDCGERIVSPFQCPVHEDETPIFYSGIQIGDKIVKIPSELRDELLERKDPISVIGTMKMSDLPEFLLDTVVVGNYFVEPQGLDDIRSPHANALQSLFDKLRQRKRLLVVTLGISGLKRYALMFPNGRLSTLSYTEELVEGSNWQGNPTREMNGHMLRYVDSSLVYPVPLSLKSIAKRVDAWLSSHMPAPRQNTKKKSVAKEKANA